MESNDKPVLNKYEEIPVRVDIRCHIEEYGSPNQLLLEQAI